MKITVVGSDGRDRWTLLLAPVEAGGLATLCSVDYRKAFDYLPEYVRSSASVSLCAMPVQGEWKATLLEFFTEPIGNRQIELPMMEGSIRIEIQKPTKDFILGPQNWCFSVELSLGTTKTTTRFQIDHTCLEIEDA